MRARRLLVLSAIAWIALPAVALAQEAPPIPDRNAYPSIATSPDGAIHLVWVDGPVGNQAILYSRWDGEAWSEPETVAGDAGVAQLDVLVRPDGVPCAYWGVLSLLESCRVAEAWTEPLEVARGAASSVYKPAFAPDGELAVMRSEAPDAVYFEDVLLNPADEVVTFPEFVVDGNGDLHAFWWDFTEDRGWVWSHSSDGGATWSPFESLSVTLPQATGTLVVADGQGGVHSVLLDAFSIEQRHWTSGSGWSETETVEFTPGAIYGGMTILPDGTLHVVAATSEGALAFELPPGGGWSEPELVEGTEGRSIDAVLTASDGDGEVVVLWHETGAALFNHAAAGGESLVASVPSPSEISLDPVVVATSVAVTAGLVFLFPFPGEMFNNVLAEHYDEIRQWFRRKREAVTTALWDKPVGIALFIVAGALLFGFLDPGFGPNAASAGVFLGLVVGLLVVTVGFALPTLVHRRARTGEWGRLRALPLGLVIGAGCVILSRAIGFVPGYLYAIVVGLVFAGEVSALEDAREVRASALTLMVLAIASWVGLGAFRSGDGTGFLADAVEAALAMITVSAFEALVIGLLPLHGMPGKALFSEMKTWWIVIWGLSVFAFFHILINPSSGYLVDTTLVPALTTIGLLAFFALMSLGFWAYFAFRGRRTTTPTPV